MSNKVHMVGTIQNDVTYSHTTGKEKFHTFRLGVTRDSGVEDSLNIIVSERILDGHNYIEGERVEINGQYRSYTKYNEEGTRTTQLFVFVTYMTLAEEGVGDINDVVLIGDIIRCYSCRRTNSGRSVIDFVMKVKRDYGRYDYLNCIAWGRDAIYIEKKYGSDVDKGEHDGAQVVVSGRLQSRKFNKRTDNGDIEKEIFELSVNNISEDLQEESTEDKKVDTEKDKENIEE